MTNVVGREEWLEARKALLAREKAFTREREALVAARQALPRVRIEEPYAFDGADRTHTLRDLFGEKRQLIVYHFMFAPEWEAGCKSCSLVAETFDRTVVHLAARDTAFYAVSRAPIDKLLAYRSRMGWTFPWVSSGRSRFNFDFSVSFSDEAVKAKTLVDYNYRQVAADSTDLPGFSSFLREGDDVFHTYSTYRRGVESLMNIYTLLDITPLGRHEEGRGMAWLRRRDEY